MELDVARVLLDLDCPICDEDRIKGGYEIINLRKRLEIAKSQVEYLGDQLERSESANRLGEVRVAFRRGRT